MALESVEV